MATTSPPAQPQSLVRRTLVGTFAWAVIPAVAVALMVAVLAESGVTLRVILGRGVPGIFTAEQQHCSHSRNGASCEWRGRFDGDDGVVRQPVHLDGDPRGWRPGSTGKAIWLPDRPDSVFHAGDPRPMLLVLGLSVTAAGVLAIWVVAVTCRLLGRPCPGWVARVHRFCGWPPTT